MRRRFKPGDVVHYTPIDGDAHPQWIAIVDEPAYERDNVCFMAWGSIDALRDGGKSGEWFIGPGAVTEGECFRYAGDHDEVSRLFAIYRLAGKGHVLDGR